MTIFVRLFLCALSFLEWQQGVSGPRAVHRAFDRWYTAVNEPFLGYAPGWVQLQMSIIHLVEGSLLERPALRDLGLASLV